MKTLWGIDLGGTKIEGAILDAETFHPIHRLRIPTEAAQGYEHIIGRLQTMVEMLESESGLTRPLVIGVGTPGAPEPSTGLMKNANTTALIGKPLPKDLSAALGIEARVTNDANCFALAEATMGAAKGAAVVFGVIMGTGVGGGVVVNGQVLGGAQGIAGEWGHNLLDPAGDKCYCGKVGCVETVLAGPSVERHYQRATGVSVRLPEIVERSLSGEKAAEAALANLCEKFGEALSVVVNILDPDVIVIGGGVGNLDCLYTDGVESLKKHVFNTRLDTRVVRPTLGDSAGVFGAAALAM